MHISSTLSSHPDSIEVIYPNLCIILESKLTYSYENAKYAQMMENTFDRFDALCRFHTVSIQQLFQHKLFPFHTKIAMICLYISENIIANEINRDPNFNRYSMCCTLIILNHFNSMYILQYVKIDSDISLTDIIDHTHHPDYWVSKWSIHNDKRLIYQICDGSIGLLLSSGQTIKQTPDER